MLTRISIIMPNQIKDFSIWKINHYICDEP